MQDQQGGQEEVEDIVSRENANHLCGLDTEKFDCRGMIQVLGSPSGVDQVSRVDRQPGVNPGEGEHCKANVTQTLPLDIFGHLGQLQPVVSEVMDQEDKGANPV